LAVGVPPTSASRSGDQFVETPFKNEWFPRAQVARFRPLRTRFGESPGPARRVRLFDQDAKTDTVSQESPRLGGPCGSLLFLIYRFGCMRPEAKTQRTYERSLELVSGGDFGGDLPHFQSRRPPQGPRGPPWAPRGSKSARSLTYLFILPKVFLEVACGNVPILVRWGLRSRVLFWARNVTLRSCPSANLGRA
jgi:hypothetical protein